MQQQIIDSILAGNDPENPLDRADDECIFDAIFNCVTDQDCQRFADWISKHSDQEHGSYEHIREESLNFLADNE